MAVPLRSEPDAPRHRPAGRSPDLSVEDAVTAQSSTKHGGTRIRRHRPPLPRLLRYSSRKWDCRRVTCDLHPFRLGKNPNRAAKPEQREIKAARLKANITRKKNRDVD
jgi:hypothetical protein